MGNVLKFFVSKGESNESKVAGTGVSKDVSCVLLARTLAGALLLTAVLTSLLTSVLTLATTVGRRKKMLARDRQR